MYVVTSLRIATVATRDSAMAVRAAHVLMLCLLTTSAWAQEGESSQEAFLSDYSDFYHSDSPEVRVRTTWICVLHT